MSSVRSKQHAISHFFQTKKARSEAPVTTHTTATNGPIVKNASISKFSFNRDNDKSVGIRDSVKKTDRTGSVKRKSPIKSEPVVKKKRTTFTPLEKQIIEFKQSHKDKLLLFQVGYKYKAFGSDAAKVSQILNIMYIQGGDDGSKEEFSYCSFPDNRLHINLKRILEHGHKVGVIKQVESAIVKSIEKSSKSDLMKREVTGVYTKGTYMDDEIVASGSNFGLSESTNTNYIVCINEMSHNEYALVAVQPLTGEIIYDQFKDILTREQLETRLTYLNPIEIIVINYTDDISTDTKKVLNIINNDIAITHKPSKQDSDIVESLYECFELLEQGKHQELSDFYTVTFSNSIQNCFYELIVYLSEFKLTSIFTIPTNISTFSDSHRYMVLPANTIETLQIFKNTDEVTGNHGTLIWLLDHTRTKFGSRMLRQWISRPLVEPHKIRERSHSIEDLRGEFSHVIDALKNQLDKLGKTVDLEHLLMKVHYSCSSGINKITRRELYQMLNCFHDVLNIVNQFDRSIEDINKKFKSKLLLTIINDLQAMSKESTVEDLLKLINTSYLMNESKDINEQKKQFFNPNYSPWNGIEEELNEIKQVEELLGQELIRIQKLLKRPQLQYITKNNEPYLIEVRNGKQVDELPASFLRVNGTTTVSRFRTEETQRLLKLLEYHQELHLNKCDEAFNDFLSMIDKEYVFFRRIVNHLSTFDCLLSLTAASLLNSNYCQPELVDEQVIEVKKGRNPIIENLPHITNFVANDINISYNKDRALIITGPNMGGKSSYVNQVALLVIMAQIGCYIPCDFARIGVFDSIFIRMGAHDNILRGNSTFKTEMLECSTILNELTSRSLVILDEIGRGTGTIDGIALAYSILNYLVECKQKPLVLFITHFPSLHVLEDKHPEVKNYHMGFKEVHKDIEGEFPEIIFLYNLVQGVVNNSYGLNVAKLAGLPTDLISNAYKISEQLKNRVEVESMEKFATQFIRILQQLQDESSKQNILEQLEHLFTYL
ncbi:DNA mismatch repair protein MSH3 [Scheffersomyces amazonensis]|uniref:DNA mismatch repair protein MSH3 n=1 Tax=Scheffersomyces amazonensis TaxID=1078765 RepID=UPI00315C8834